MAGGLSHNVAALLIAGGHQVVGVDYRPVPPLAGTLAEVPIYTANYNKTSIEDVFRRHSFDTVLHLGRVGNLKEEIGKRFDLNVVGSQKIMNLCLAHRVRRLVVLSTFHIYGAHPANHIPISEDDPLRAGLDFPQLADAIQLDNMASTWVYRHPEVKTAVLRPTNVVGPEIQNTMSRFLRLERVPHVLGFNPMMQFIHEADLARAIEHAAHGDERGIFNVAGADLAPWRTVLELAKAKTYPIPSTLASAYLKLIPTPFPGYMLNFFKYPCVITDARFRRAFDWAPTISLRETVWSTVAHQRALQQAAH